MAAGKGAMSACRSVSAYAAFGVVCCRRREESVMNRNTVICMCRGFTAAKRAAVDEEGWLAAFYIMYSEAYVELIFSAQDRLRSGGALPKRRLCGFEILSHLSSFYYRYSKSLVSVL